MKRMGWGGVAVAGWLLLGLVGMWVSPEDTPSPGESQFLFGSLPSMQSSAPAGLFAFARLLARMGFEVDAHLSPRPPQDAVWVLLEPNVILSDEEVTSVMEWLDTGGRLIYVSKRIDVTLDAGLDPGKGDDTDAGEENLDATEPEDTPSQDTPMVTLDDPLRERLAEGGRHGEELAGATVWQVGTGKAAVLVDAGVLSNESLSAHGLRDELVWLNPLLADRRRVVFDEARLGAAPEESALDLLRDSHYGPALNLALIALVVWLVARGARRQPARVEPPAGARAFGEHLDAVGSLLLTGGRARLAAESLLAGTRRRLAGLAAAEEARAVLASAEIDLHAGHLVRGSERLREIEARLRVLDKLAA